MPRQNAETPGARFPKQVQPDRSAVERSLELLDSWRSGSAATAIVVAGLLPFAVAWHVTYLAAIFAALVIATILTFSCQLTLQSRLARLAVYPEFAHLRGLARRRRRLVSDRSRRALAHGLRRTAAPTQPPARFDCCPVLQDRAAAERSQLLAIATALELEHNPDPACVALIHELLTNACSPLYNDNIPAADLHTTLKRLRAALTPEPPS